MPEGVVVVPLGRRAVGVRVLEDRETRPPHRAVGGGALPAKKSYQVPSVAYPVGTLLAAGRYHASA